MRTKNSWETNRVARSLLARPQKRLGKPSVHILPMFLLLFAWGAVLPNHAFADPSMAAKCFMTEAGEVKGNNVNQLVRWASVSKVFTSSWAIHEMGAASRFATRFHLTPVAGRSSQFDLHISGGRDPVLNRSSMQYILSQLNQAGYDQFGMVTVDENFVFLSDTLSQSFANRVDHLPGTPGRRVVLQELTEFFLNPNQGVEQASADAQRARGLSIRGPLRAKVMSWHTNPPDQPDRVGFVASQDWKSQPGTVALEYRSVPLIEIVKEMNRTSNNYIANLLFEGLGGVGEFTKFAQDKLGLDEKEFRFESGSGLPVMSPGRKDNWATCDAVLVTLKDLTETLEQDRTLGPGRRLSLQDALAVSGVAASNQPNTVRAYATAANYDALVAKTGTINPAIGLAGMLSTKQGRVYFAYSVAMSSQVLQRNNRAEISQEQQEARGMIRQELAQLLRDFGGAEPMGYNVRAFSTFDRQSGLFRLGAGRGNENLLRP